MAYECHITGVITRTSGARSARRARASPVTYILCSSLERLDDAMVDVVCRYSHGQRFNESEPVDSRPATNAPHPIGFGLENTEDAPSVPGDERDRVGGSLKLRRRGR
jgi:hypothetical protein